MKRILRFFTFLSNLLIITINSSLITGCTLFTHNFNRNDNVSMLQYDIPNEHDFILKYETEITNKADITIVNKFNNLYDSDKTHVLWKNYNSLQTDLLNTPMGQHNSEDNWDKLLDEERVVSDKKILAEEYLLRFYNILGELYGHDVIIKLVQSITKIPLNQNVIAWTSYNSTYNNLRMGFESNAFNTSFINQEYNQGWWATNNIISIIAHEIGHALSIYLSLDTSHRATFNNDWNINSNNSKSNLVPYGTKLDLLSHEQQKIDDSSNYLIQYLNKQANVVIKNKVEEVLLSLIVVRSNFGRGAWVNLNMKIPKDELFAEAFNQWILTPESERNWNWELLNYFFMDYLPSAFK